ncbi:MAG TPA: VWA domain-containing protein [Myxococcaceae bacterium]|nr:VWA domain-containing protein [Myxococcaceae bacterium]
MNRSPRVGRPLAPLLLLATLLPCLASATEPEIPEWAQDWKKTYLSAKANGSLQMTGSVSRKFLNSGDQELFAVLELSTVDFPPGEPSPAGVAVVIDRSASTAGRRLLIAKKVTLAILAGLTERDHLSIIRVSNKIDSMPLLPVTPENREKFRAYVEETTAEGRSDLSGGLDSAHEELSKLVEGNFYRQLILLSDGQPTEGMVDGAGLAAIARDFREDDNVHVSTVAIGEDADLEVMTGMAKEGWGFTARLNDSASAQLVARRQHLELIRRAADKITVRVKLDPAVRLVEVIGHDSSRQGSTLQIPVGEMGPGEVLPIVLHLAVKAAGTQVRTMELAQVELQYENALTEHTRLQDITIKAELNPARAKGPGALDADASRYAARAILERNLARAEENAEENNATSARQLLDEARASLKRMSGQAPFDATRELALLDTRTAELSRKYPELAQPAKATKKTKSKSKKKRKS